jgi:hypothetical protein
MVTTYRQNSSRTVANVLNSTQKGLISRSSRTPLCLTYKAACRRSIFTDRHGGSDEGSLITHFKPAFPAHGQDNSLQTSFSNIQSKRTDSRVMLAHLADWHTLFFCRPLHKVVFGRIYLELDLAKEQTCIDRSQFRLSYRICSTYLEMQLLSQEYD